MELYISVAPFSITSNNRYLGDILPGRSYPMDDPEHHTFIVRQYNSTLLIHIRRGGEVVRRGTVKLCSATAGTDDNGNPRLQKYTVELDPAKAIYSRSAAIDALLAARITSEQISPMFTPELQHNAPLGSDPRMTTDGQFEHYDLAATRGLGASRTLVVAGATYAIFWFAYGDSNVIHRVYLWDGAENNIDAMLADIARIRSGTVETAEVL